jgi:uncharacterized protein (DUF779 family)
MTPPSRALITADAADLLRRLQDRTGAVMFHQSGGCCDGSAPMCFPQGDFLLGDNDVHLGDIGGVPFYISESQYEYWCHTQLIIDVVPGRGGMFSLEGPTGKRFLTRSRFYEDAEWDALVASGKVKP